MQQTSTSVPHKVTPRDHMTGETSIDILDWKISSKKQRMLDTLEMEQLHHSLSAPALPEMVFGGSRVEFKHLPSGFTLHFTAQDALACWDPSSPSVKVAASSAWAKTRSAHAKDVARQFDWTYSTDYKGTVVPGQTPEGSRIGSPSQTTDTIDLDKLRIPEPILFFDEIVLFEDELADNGTALYSVKLRVMPTGFYCLARFFLRVDDVLIRGRETRIYHAFNTKYILREHSLRESTYLEIDRAGKTPKDPSSFASPDIMVPLLELRSAETDKMALPEDGKEKEG